jgi:hypothetical protein
MQTTIKVEDWGLYFIGGGSLNVKVRTECTMDSGNHSITVEMFRRTVETTRGVKGTFN